MSDQQPPADPQQPYGQPAPPPPPVQQQSPVQQPPYGQSYVQQPYGQPGYPPQPGLPAPMPVYGPPGTAHGYPPNSDERTWAMLSHGSFFVLSIIGPLVIMLTKGKESPFVRQQAVEALNFHLSVLIYSLVSAVLMIVLIGFLTFFAVFIAGVVFAIQAIVAGNRGESFHYPLTIRMVS